MALAGQGKYTFEVDSRAVKGQIKSAVTEFFGVNVLSVKTVKMPGRKKRKRGRRGFTMVPDGKKAVVEVKKGQKIELFDVEDSKAEEQKGKSAKAQKIKTEDGKKTGFAGKVAGMLKGKGKQVSVVQKIDPKVQKSGDK